MSQQYLFLCGVGRSGTTVFRAALGQHPEIYYNGMENNIVQDVLAVAEQNCTQDSRRVALAVNHDRYDAIFRTAIGDLIWPDLNLRNRPIWMAAINPEGRQANYLTQLFPGAKIICLVRNGIEVIASRLRYRSFAALPFESQCQTWIRNEALIDWGAHHRQQFRLFRHEWLCCADQLRDEIAELTAWLGIRSNPQVVEYILHNLRHPSAATAHDISQMDDRQRLAHFQRAREQWRDWPTTQRQTFASICGGMMRRLGYELPNVA